MAVVQGIETCINVRWEEGMDHHPESEKVIRAMALVDYKLCGLALDISTGGDGDNGETMMYMLDIYFEAMDKGLNWEQFISQAEKVA